MVFGGDRELPGIFRRVASQKAPAREIEYPESCSWAPKNLFSYLSKIRNVAEHFWFQAVTDVVEPKFLRFAILGKLFVTLPNLGAVLVQVVFKNY